MQNPVRRYVAAVALVIGVMTGLLLTQPAPAQEKEKPAAAPALRWEYKQIVMGGGEKAGAVEDEFNRLGGEGWELAGIYKEPAGAGSTRFVFKRPKR